MLVKIQTKHELEMTLRAMKEANIFWIEGEEATNKETLNAMETARKRDGVIYLALVISGRAKSAFPFGAKATSITPDEAIKRLEKIYK